VEEVLGLHTAPCTWPVGSGDRFQGVYDRMQRHVLKFERTEKNARQVPFEVAGIEDAQLDALLGEEPVRALREEVALLEGAGEQYDRARFLRGEITPVFFGSALTNFGVEPFLDAFATMCPPPGPQASSAGPIDPESDRFTGFVFKVQANMDPQHRDRIAFLRVCSGKFEPGMRVFHARLGKEIRLAHAEKIMAAERQIIDEAWAGDILGLYDPGIFRIGDSLATGGPVEFATVPRFSPEHFARLRLVDPLKRKQLQKGVSQLAEEGTLQVFLEPGREKDPILGVVGELQFDVLRYRLEHEYGAPVELERLAYNYARWVEGPESPDELRKARIAMGVWDQDQRPVALLRDDWELRRAAQDNPKWTFHQTAPITSRAVEA
jgi:peptide chain release factor 3